MDDYNSLHPYDHISRSGNSSNSRLRSQAGVDCKIVVMGNSGVGKTSLLQRYTLNRFTYNTMSTSGALFSTKKITLNGVKVSMQLWDTAGQERFKSMAPMYYRGANAALLLYDITDSSSFNDVKGWLEELKKNSAPDLLIYIVGSKADLQKQRQVTPDLARAQLHSWFPPAPPPPPVPRPESKTSYIRPRFTSFPGLSSAPKTSNPSNPPTPGGESPSGSSSTSITAATNKTSLDLIGSPTSASTSTSYSSTRPSSALTRSRTSSARPRRTSAGPTVLTRSKTTGSPADHQKGHRHSMSIPNLPTSKGVGSKIWGGGDGSGWIWGSSAVTAADEGSDSIEEEEDDEGREEEWGLEKGMELFEVSAKDGVGIQNLFDHLLRAILERLDKIEAENEKKRRDSVFLGSSSDLSRPGWSAQADEEERRLREEGAKKSSIWARGGCCT